MGSHVGLMEGLENAADLRERILARSQLNTGLGDERGDAIGGSLSALNLNSAGQIGDSKQNVQLLKEIQALTGRLTGRKLDT